MKIKKEYKKIVERYDSVMEVIGAESSTINGYLSEIESNRSYYDVQGGVTIGWMKREAEYWLSCYTESGHCRYEDRKDSPEAYKVWVSEKGYLSRLVKALDKYPADAIVEEA